MNTTAAETGGRFLLSKYHVLQSSNEKSYFLQAESFLQAYTQDTLCVKLKAYADVSLATAARLSATLPYVSSGTRIPQKFADHAYHFLDGGYNDNSGTASVIEFPMAALEPIASAGQVQSTAAANESGQIVRTPGTAAGASPKKLKILLVEIRDGSDLDATTNSDDYAHQVGVGSSSALRAWKSGSQILGPAQVLWNVGHVSSTRWNRLQLCLLESAYKDRLEIRHLVFTIDPDAGKTAPMSWHLTAGQRKYIDWARGNSTQEMMHESVDWVKSAVPS